MKIFIGDEERMAIEVSEADYMTMEGRPVWGSDGSSKAMPKPKPMVGKGGKKKPAAY